MRPAAFLCGPVLLAVTGLAAGRIQASDPPIRRVPTFTTRLEMVSLVVSVADVHGRPVAGLDRRAFTVLEDGAPQELSLFSDTPVPLSLAILVDTSGSMERTLPIAQAAATNLLEPLQAGDEATVAQFNQRYQVRQGFTQDLPALARALHALRANGATALYDAVYCALKELSGRVSPGEVRRQALVLLSDGEDTGSLSTEEQALDLARHAGVVVYTIGLRAEPPADRGRPRFDQARHFLTALAHDTGGQAYFISKLSDLAGVYASIAEELRTQYTLGYVPRNPRNDGSWRRIAVITTPSNFILRHRTGYFAPRERLAVGGR